jgi:hypothetical protein
MGQNPENQEENQEQNNEIEIEEGGENVDDDNEEKANP